MKKTIDYERGGRQKESYSRDEVIERDCPLCNSRDYSKVSQSLKEIRFGSLFSLFETYTGRRKDLTEWLKNAQINRDHNFRLQYLAGMGLNSFQGEEIFDEMLSYRKFPEDLFIASEQDKNALRQAMETGDGDDDILP